MVDDAQETVLGVGGKGGVRMEDRGEVAAEGGGGGVYPLHVKLHEFHHDVEAGDLYLDDALVAIDFFNREVRDLGVGGGQAGAFHEAATV